MAFRSSCFEIQWARTLRAHRFLAKKAKRAHMAKIHGVVYGADTNLKTNASKDGGARREHGSHNLADLRVVHSLHSIALLHAAVPPTLLQLAL